MTLYPEWGHVCHETSAAANSIPPSFPLYYVPKTSLVPPVPFRVLPTCHPCPPPRAWQGTASYRSYRRFPSTIIHAETTPPWWGNPRPGGFVFSWKIYDEIDLRRGGCSTLILKIVVKYTNNQTNNGRGDCGMDDMIEEISGRHGEGGVMLSWFVMSEYRPSGVGPRKSRHLWGQK